MADHINLKDLLKGTDYEEVPNKVKQHSDIILPKGKRIVLQAGSEENARGLVVTWKADGGYDIAYWYDTPSNIVPAELKGDGKSFGDIKNVYLGFHPELDDDKAY
tara:strand:+ start:57 stop:371 length:315 start_codon:yes stop_codon:yes gene_type:complete